MPCGLHWPALPYPAGARDIVADALWRSLATALGSPVRASRAVGGGDINEAYRVTLEDGRIVFVKLNRRSLPGMFAAEARGLEWLAEARALRVPKVLAQSSPQDAPSYLALEYIDPGRSGTGYDEALGRGLAELHRYGAPCFGLDHSNYIGSLPQPNRPRPTWAEFYVEERLRPMVERARAKGVLVRETCRRFERLFASIEERIGEEEPPARLHGDLWGGNAMCDGKGRPVVIDPAAYGGDREIDLAMMRLFGGFTESTFDAYREAFPLRPGAAERVSLYQLYPLLVHVNLFGGSYVGSVDRALRAYV